jgi:hypothetical protein
MEEALTTTVEGWPSGNTVMDGDSAVRVNVTGAGVSAGATDATAGASAGATDATAGASAGATDATAGASAGATDAADAGPAGTGTGTGCRNTLWRRCSAFP